MKTIIAGSRYITEPHMLERVLRDYATWPITEVISGGCKGVDALGEAWAAQNGIPCTVVHPEWEKYGNKAGPIRNAKMADMADALILIWFGKSPGSRSMKKEAEKRGLRCFEWIVRED